MRHFIKISIAASIMLMTLVSAHPAPAEIRIAFVDVQRALNECDAGKRAMGQFRVKVERIQSRLQKQQSQIQALKQELDKKAMLMKEDERRGLLDEYQRKARDFDRDYKDSKEDLQKQDKQITGQIISDLFRVIRNLSEKNGYSLVLEKSSILWGAAAIDITDQVVHAYNSSGGKIGSMGGGQPYSSSGGGASGGAAGGGPSLSGGPSAHFGANAMRRSTISK